MASPAHPTPVTTQPESADDPVRWLPGFMCSKALDLREIEHESFVLVDPLGGQTAPFRVSNHDEMLAKLRDLANVVPLTHADGRLMLGAGHQLDGPTIPWCLEEPYVARIPDSYRLWLVGRGDHRKFETMRLFLPLAYLEAGFGTGSRDMFEQIHTEMLNGNTPAASHVPKEMLLAFLHHTQLQRLCDDLLALVDRAATAFQRVLILMRRAVTDSAHTLDHFEVGEVQHASPLSADIATQLTVAVVSAATSMDLIVRLVGFINGTELPPPKFRPPGTSYYADLKTMLPRALPRDVLDRIQAAWTAPASLSELIQFRHDLIHSTTALEVERHVYIGRGTEQINSLPLHYAQIPARDSSPNGQPVRYLGREFFTAEGRNMDEVLCTWLVATVSAHATTAGELASFIDAARMTATHTLPGT